MWIADQWKDYQVLDTSKGEKLERWGDYLLVRPDPQVIWDTPKKNPGWKKMNGHYHRSKKGGGEWEFFNLPELMAIFKMVADVQTADMLNLPVPKANFHTEVIQPNELQRAVVAELAERAERVRARMVDPSTDNMLRITNDGRKLALDMRLINPLAADAPNGKVATCARNVARIWAQTKDRRSTQLVFCDRVAIRCYK